MKEMIKSLLLISLTISALIMTNLVFNRTPETIIVTSNEYETDDLIDLIRPQNYVFSFGDLFIKVHKDEYNGIPVEAMMQHSFKSFIDVSTDGDGENLSKKQITEDEWLEATRRKSVTMNFPYSIKLDDFLSVLGYEVNPSSDVESERVTSVLMLLNTKDTVYFYDEIKDEYYKLKGSSSQVWFENVFNDVEEKRDEQDRYKQVEDRYALLKTFLSQYNIETPNRLLTPLSDEIYYPKYKLIPNINSTTAVNDVETYASNVFNNELNFVKKIVYEDNEIMFMYGNADKLLKYNNDGSLEYIERENNNSEKETLGFVEGLGMSKEQIEKMGESISSSLYLSGYQQVETNNAVETVYYFNYTKNGIPYYLEGMRDGNLIEVRFTNKQLVKAKVNLFITDQGEEVYYNRSFADVFSRNQIQFVLDYESNNPLTEIQKEHLNWICLHEMDYLELRYEIINDELIPTWHMSIADTDYKVDLIEGEIIREK